MTVKNCYSAFGGDYDGVMARMPDEKFVAEFLGMFLEDECYPMLKKAMEEKNAEAAFRAVHSLKGICQNFGYTKLLQSSSELTEVLRGGSMEGAEQPMLQVDEDYRQMIETIKKLDVEPE